VLGSTAVFTLLLSGCLAIAEEEPEGAYAVVLAEPVAEEVEGDEVIEEAVGEGVAFLISTEGGQGGDGLADEELAPVLKYVEEQAEGIEKQEDGLQDILSELKLILCEERQRYAVERGWYEGRNFPPKPKVSAVEPEETHAEWGRFVGWWSECPDTVQRLSEEARGKVILHLAEQVVPVAPFPVPQESLTDDPPSLAVGP